MMAPSCGVSSIATVFLVYYTRLKLNAHRTLEHFVPSSTVLLNSNHEKVLNLLHYTT